MEAMEASAEVVEAPMEASAYFHLKNSAPDPLGCAAASITVESTASAEPVQLPPFKYDGILSNVGDGNTGGVCGADGVARRMSPCLLTYSVDRWKR